MKFNNKKKNSEIESKLSFIEKDNTKKISLNYTIMWSN